MPGKLGEACALLVGLCLQIPRSHFLLTDANHYVYSRFNSSILGSRRENLQGLYDIHTNIMQYPKIMQPTHVRWESVTPPDSNRPSRLRLLNSASAAALGLTNGAPDQSADDQPTSNGGSGQVDDMNKPATIFPTVPAIFSRNFSIHDIYYQSPPYSSLGIPGPDGDVLDLSSNGLISISTKDGNPVFHASPSVLAELPLDCRLAYREAAEREWEWKRLWQGESMDGARAVLPLSYSWNP
jgi:chromatin structure-remodeling complex protein RSC7